MTTNKIYTYGSGALMMAAPIYVPEIFQSFVPFIFWFGLLTILAASILNIRDYVFAYNIELNNLSFKYISLLDAATQLRNENLRQGNTQIEAIDQIDEFDGKSSAIQFYADFVLGDYPVWGRRKDSKVWEKIEDRKKHPQLHVTIDGNGLKRDGKVIYPCARMLRSDFKKYMKSAKESNTFIKQF